MIGGGAVVDHRNARGRRIPSNPGERAGSEACGRGVAVRVRTRVTADHRRFSRRVPPRETDAVHATHTRQETGHAGDITRLVERYAVDTVYRWVMQTREVPVRQFRDKLADQLDAVQHHGEILIVTRRGGGPAVAVVPLSFLTLKTIDEANSAFRYQLLNSQTSRAELAEQYRALASVPGGLPIELPGGESGAIEGLLKELSAIYADDPLGKLAAELAEQILNRKYGQFEPPPISKS